MGKRLFLLLALVFATFAALPQTTPAPIQVAEPDEKTAPAAEQPVVLPPQTGLFIGVAAATGLLLLLALPVTVECNDGGDCGQPIFTTTTGTR